MNPRINIMLITPTIKWGGAERFISLLANHLNQEIFQVHLIVLNGEHQFYQIRPEVVLYDLGIKRVRNSIFKIRELIYKLQPQLVFSTFSHLNLAVAVGRFLFPRKLKFIARESVVLTKMLEDKTQVKYPWIYKTLARFFLPKLDVLICQSTDMESALLSLNIRAKKLVVIHNPVEIVEIQKKSQKDCEKNYDIVSVGRLFHQKGYDRLIKIIHQYTQKYGKNFQLAIIGDGPERANIEQLIEQFQLGQNIHLLGKQLNPFKFFQQARLFLSTTRFEGFPNAFLEANACGLPIVSFQVPGGINEIIQEGINGFTVKDNDSKLMVEQIHQALFYSFDRQEIVRNTTERFGVERIIQKYEELLLSLVSINTKSLKNSTNYV